MKRFIFTALAVLMTAQPAFCASDDGFIPDNGMYHQLSRFADVPEGAWYLEYVNIAADFGVLNGRENGLFMPNDGVTCAEAIKMAACAHASMHHFEISETGGDHWYDKYYNYCRDWQIIEPHVKMDMTKKATRAEVAYLFARVDKTGPHINEVPITDIPDVDGFTPYYHEIMDMYETGAATGDSSMAFHPNDNIKRSEAAAMITRVMCYDLRITLPKG